MFKIYAMVLSVGSIVAFWNLISFAVETLCQKFSKWSDQMWTEHKKFGYTAP